MLGVSTVMYSAEHTNRSKAFPYMVLLRVLHFIQFQAVGVDGGEDPPVPIPNTEVKLSCAESTWLATTREDRYTPV